MSKIKLTSWVPIRNVVSEDSIVHKNFNNCLENLISSGTFALKNLSNKIVDAVLSLKEPPSKVLKPLTLLNYDGYLEKLKYCTFVRIDAEMNYNLKEINSSNTKKLNKDDLIGIGACDLSLFIQDLFILCSLAYPGHFHTEIGQVFFSVLPMNTVEKISGFPHHLFYEIPNKNWLKFLFIDLKKVSEWEQRLGLFEKGFAENPVQKAVASFTHILKQDVIDDFELLFWALQGLEAFYCDGKSDFRSQLKEKTKIFLGDWKEEKNIIGHLYDLRSRFVHGDFPIERWNNEISYEYKNKKDYDRLFEVRDLAIGILVATLQKCINQNYIDLKFEYMLKPIEG